MHQLFYALLNGEGGTKLNNPTPQKLLVAIGSAHGDDRAAWDIADLLTSQSIADFQTRKASIPINMIDWLEGVNELHVVDACEGDGNLGQLLRFELPPNSDNGRQELEPGTSKTPESSTSGSAESAPGRPLQAQSSTGHPIVLRRAGTHDFDVLSVLELACALNCLPERIVIWGIVGRNFEPSDILSGEIVGQLPVIADAIRKELTGARKISGAVATEAG